MDLNDKVVFITGSSTGIGAASAKLFAAEGAKVVVTYRSSKEEGEAVCDECGEEALLLPLDVTDPDSVQKAFDEAKKRFGRIDILVNNAGVIRWKEFSEQTFGDIDAQIDVNYRGLLKTTKIFLPELEENEGVIINIASQAGKQGYATISTYCGTKFAVRGFTQALAQELENARVYAVNPGMTATEMTGYKGVPPEDVADVVLNTAKENLGKSSGDDVDVSDY